MKTNYWIILGAMLSTSLMAQTATNTPSAITTPAAAPAATISAEAPAPATNAPAAKAKKKSGKKKGKSAQKKPAPKKTELASELKTVPLAAGPAICVASNVNVRGQAKLKSEV